MVKLKDKNQNCMEIQDVTANVGTSDDAEQPQQQLEVKNKEYDIFRADEKGEFQVLQSASGADQDHYQAITVVDGKENLWPGESQVKSEN